MNVGIMLSLSYGSVLQDDFSRSYTVSSYNGIDVHLAKVDHFNSKRRYMKEQGISLGLPNYQHAGQC